MSTSGLGLVGLFAFPQGVPTRTLVGPAVELPEAFSLVGGVRELRDGRTLVLDRSEGLLLLADFRSGTALQIGRQGRGPAEYDSPTRLFALADGTSAVRDDGNGRTIRIGADGAFEAVVDWAAGGGGPGPIPGMRTFVPAASDTLGRYYQLARPVRVHPNGTTELADSAAVERLDLAAKRRDTVAFMPAPEGAGRSLDSGTTRVVVRPSSRVHPYRTADQWLVAPDGRVAVVSPDPYRVTYFEDGSVLVGPTITFERVRVTQRDKDEWLASQQAPQETWVVPTRTSPVQRTMARGPATRFPIEWPTHFPPFVGDTMFFAPDGRLWVGRAVSVDSAPTFDLIDRRGRLSERVILARKSRLIGFGPHTIYVVRIDDDGLEFLQRYPFHR